MAPPYGPGKLGTKCHLVTNRQGSSLTFCASPAALTGTTRVLPRSKGAALLHSNLRRPLFAEFGTRIKALLTSQGTRPPNHTLSNIAFRLCETAVPSPWSPYLI